jgi:hypothetical protein
MTTPSSSTLSSQIKQLEEEINELKIHLEKYHFTKSPEQDFDVKTRIIEKQNEMIELLIREREGK